MKKMSLHDALSRVGNPRLRRGGAKLSASARDLIDAGLGRVANKGKKKAAKKKASVKAKSKKAKSKKAKSKKASARKSPARKGKSRARKVSYAQAHAAGAGSPEMKAYMAGIRGKKGKAKSKKKRSKRAANPSARLRHARAHGRVHNGRKRRVRRHRAHARRRHNPGFDVKATLIQTGLLVAGAFVAARLAPIVGEQLGKIGYLKENPKFIGYAHLAAGALVAVAGDYLQDRFGGRLGFDVRPAAIAAGAVLAYDGLKRAELVPASGTFALTGPAAGTFALTGPAMSGALVLPNLNDPNAMLGTYDYGMGATVLANLPESNAMLGSIFDDSDSMHGTVFTAAELPVPVVAPHSVMQASQVVTPQMC